VLGGGVPRTRLAAAVAACGGRPSGLRGRLLRVLGDREDARVRLTWSGALAFLAILLVGVCLGAAAIRSAAMADAGCAGPDRTERQSSAEEKKAAPSAKRTMSVRVADQRQEPIACATVRLRTTPDTDTVHKAEAGGKVAIPLPDHDSTWVMLICRTRGYVPLSVHWRGAKQNDAPPGRSFV